MSKEKNTTLEATPEVEAVAPKKIQDPDEELVSITLFKDGDKYKDDVVVVLNGRVWQIKRGIAVMVPRKVANVIALSQKQDLHANEIMQQMQDEYKEASRLYNI